MLRVLIAASLVLLPVATNAQDQTTPPAPATNTRCLLAGKTFSPGATIRASAVVNVCALDGTWATTQQTAAGCFFADNFYAVGATAGVSGTKTQVETCGPDGSWSAAAAKD